MAIAVLIVVDALRVSVMSTVVIMAMVVSFVTVEVESRVRVLAVVIT